MPRNDKELDEIPAGKIKMGKKFFENLRNRVETVRPEAGNNIKVEKEQSGYGLKISFVGNAVTLTVCSNGTPAELVVFGITSTTTT
jgi:hypothetical protein